jgi:hypothetical protein
MKRLMTLVGAILIASTLFTSCTTLNQTMKDPNARVELTKNDFTLSNQVSAEATSTKIIGVDWSRLFMKKTGNIESSGAAMLSLANIPVVGNVLSDKTSNYALYEIMNANPGYDVVFYPSYETKVVKPILGIGFLTTITTVKATARLGKLK